MFAFLQSFNFCLHFHKTLQFSFKSLLPVSKYSLEDMNNNIQNTGQYLIRRTKIGWLVLIFIAIMKVYLMIMDISLKSSCFIKQKNVIKQNTYGIVFIYDLPTKFEFIHIWYNMYVCKYKIFIFSLWLWVRKLLRCFEIWRYSIFKKYFD